MTNEKDTQLNVRFLPKGVQNPRFEQRESGIAHTPYSREVAFYTCIKNGDLQGLESNMENFVRDALVVGRMSDDNLRQVKYLAVSCITLATRYAVEGGLMESEAYNLSDSYIQYVDKTDKPEEIIKFLVAKATELTVLVKNHRQRLEYPPFVRKAMKYVSAHLHERLKCCDVADECGVSADYLSASFKKYVGESLHEYGKWRNSHLFEAIRRFCLRPFRLCFRLRLRMLRAISVRLRLPRFVPCPCRLSQRL